MVQKILQTFASTSQSKTSRMRVGLITSIICILLNTLLSLLKCGLGYTTGSISLIADGANNFSDASSNFVTLLGFKLANKPPDKEHPYGHGRFEYVSSFIIAALIFAIGIHLSIASIGQIITPEKTDFSYLALGVMLGSIAIKFCMGQLNSKIGNLIDSDALKTAGIDSYNDCIATFSLVVCMIISQITTFELDGIAGFFVGVYIIKTGYDAILQTLNPLLGSAPSPEFAEFLTQKICAYDYVEGIHDLMVHDYGPGQIFVSAHIEVDTELGIVQAHEISDAIEFDFLENDGIELTLHVDPIDKSNPTLTMVANELDTRKATIDPNLTFHDLRIVTTTNYPTILFDCSVPQTCTLGPEELRRSLTEIVLEVVPGAVVKIRLDYHFL